MRLVDTTDKQLEKSVLTLINCNRAERDSYFAERFRLHLIGMYFSKVGREWSSGDRQESDYLHHIDLSLAGTRQVLHEGKTHVLAPGEVWFLPGNTPVQRRCREACEVIFFKFHGEWLPGVDPLLDWKGREPRRIGNFQQEEWRGWLEPGRSMGMNEQLQIRSRLLSWLATAVPNLDQVISEHLQTHTQFSKVFGVIEENLGADLRLPDLAAAYGTGLTAFTKAFNRNTGMTPKEYLTRRLNQEAIGWVINTDLKMKEIAAKLKFSDEFYFSRFFQRLNGMAPTAYRASFRSAARP